MWCFCWHEQFFIDFRKNTSCGINQSHLTLHSQIFKESKIGNVQSILEHVKTHFFVFLDYFWISYGKQIKNVFLNNHEENMLMSAENERERRHNVFDILKELLNSFQTSGSGFWYKKRFSRYRENCNYPILIENQWRYQGKVMSKVLK